MSFSLHKIGQKFCQRIFISKFQWPDNGYNFNQLNGFLHKDRLVSTRKKFKELVLVIGNRIKLFQAHSFTHNAYQRYEWNHWNGSKYSLCTMEENF